MPSNGPPGIFLLAIVAVIALVIWAAVASHKRRQAFLAWAAARGLQLDESHDSGMEDRFPELDCLRQGSDRYAYDILTGKWKEFELLAFSYHYETYSRDNKGNRQTHHHHFSVAGICGDLPLRPLLIRPEGIFDKVAGFFGAEDINFESAEFSKAFYVKSPDRKWAYDVVHARMMEYLLQSPRFSIQFTDGPYVFAYSGSTFSSEQYEQAADLLCGMLERLPEYLKREQLERTTQS